MKTNRLRNKIVRKPTAEQQFNISSRPKSLQKARDISIKRANEAQEAKLNTRRKIDDILTTQRLEAECNIGGL